MGESLAESAEVPFNQQNFYRFFSAIAGQDMLPVGGLEEIPEGPTSWLWFKADFSPPTQATESSGQESFLGRSIFATGIPSDGTSAHIVVMDLPGAAQEPLMWISHQEGLDPPIDGSKQTTFMKCLEYGGIVAVPSGARDRTFTRLVQGFKHITGEDI